MRMMLVIDKLASRYGRLPSKIIEEATTYDMVIMDAVLNYEYIQEYRANNNGKSPPVEYTTAELQEMMSKAKGQ